MDIELANFRCYRKANFTLPEKGLIQLSGSNGKGKTTIFNAISYTLFNRLKGRPYSHGTKTCSVKITLHASGLVVTRSSTPNTLQVWYKEKKYEGESAQAVINNVLSMDSDEFWISSYFSHDLQGSVISMTSEKQSEFIEKLSLKNSPHRRYIAFCGERVKELQEQIVEQKGRCASLKQSRKSISKLLPTTPPEQPKIDDVKSKKKEVEDALQKERAKIGKLQDRYARLKEVEAKTVEARKEKDTLQLKVSHYSQLISNVGGVLTEKESEELQKEIEILEIKLTAYEMIKRRKTLRKLVRDYEKDQAPIKQEIDELSELVEGVEEEDLVREIEELREEYQSRAGSEGAAKARYGDAKAEFNAIKRELKKMFKGAARLQKPSSFPKFISREVTKMKKKVKEDTSKRDSMATELATSAVMVCPNCEIELVVSEGLLELHSEEDCESTSDDIEERMLELDMSIASSNAILQRLVIMDATMTRIIPILAKKPVENEAPLDYSQIEEKETVLQSIRALEEKRKLLKQPPYISKAKKEIKKLVKTTPTDVEPIEDPVASTAELSELTEKAERALKAAGNLSVYQREINKLNRRLDTINRHLDQGLSRRKGETAPTSESVLEKLETIRVKAHSLDSELVQLKNMSIAAKEYEAYVSSKKKLKKLGKKLREAESELSKLESLLEGFKGLKKSVKEAMIVAMTDTIKCINYHAAIHLKKLFDTPIDFRLTGLTTTQKGKTNLKMSSKILYNGEEYQCIDEMSRGERQRCNLSFLLAVNDMIGSKLLMLDECLNSMDVSAKREVLDVLKEMGDERLILLASHEAVQGVFTNVIDVDH